MSHFPKRFLKKGFDNLSSVVFSSVALLTMVLTFSIS